MDIREGPEVHHMKIHMNAVTMKGPVLGEEMMIEIRDMVMMKGEVLDMIKKVDNMVITEKVLLVLKLSMTGVEKIDLVMGGNLKIVEYLMEIQSWKGGHLSDQKS